MRFEGEYESSSLMSKRTKDNRNLHDEEEKIERVHLSPP